MTDPLLSIAIILATLGGPIIAVQLTRFLDDRAATRQRRATTFRSLMATRSATISPEHVGALNTAEVDFYGVTPVETALENYINHLNTPCKDDAAEAAKVAWVERQRDLLAVLLAKMAVALGISKGEIQIRQGGYYPKGWADREARQMSAQEWVMGLASGKATIPVKIVVE
jgi:hypothetical protein